MSRLIRGAEVAGPPLRLGQRDPEPDTFVPTFANGNATSGKPEQTALQVAFQRGVAEGMRQRADEIIRQHEAAREPLARVALAVERELAELRGDLYRQTVSMAAALAECWLREIAVINPTVFLAALREAMQPLEHLDDITVKLHPDDYRTLRDGIAAGEEEFLQFARLRLVADAQIEAGGVVAESEGGSVDARLRTRIEHALGVIGAGRDAG